MVQLRGAKVFRSGETVKTYNYETESVLISNQNGKVRLQFKLASKGGGVTDVKVEAESLSFDRLLSEMYQAAPDEMVKLMARQMNGHFWTD